MKKAKRIISLLAAALLCALPLLSVPMNAEAAAPVTYSVSYDASNDGWYYQVGQWSEDNETRELYYMLEAIKDGDYLVVADGGDGELTVDVQLGNLTVVSASAAVIHTKGITDAYVLHHSRCAINGDIQNAYVYSYAVVNFNNNVGNLEIAGEDGLLRASVGVAGTVGHAKAYVDTTTHFDIYNVAAGHFLMAEGSLKTAETAYSKTAPAAVPAPAPSAGAADEYDEVPKTGDVNLAFGLAAAAAACFAGAYKVKRQ